jgi:hypothetical protein
VSKISETDSQEQEEEGWLWNKKSK